MLFQWRVLGKNGTGDWATASDWDPTGVPGANDVAAIVRATVVEDVNEPLGATSGVSVGALVVDSGANVVIGDAAGDDRALFAFGNDQNSWILGSVTVYGSTTAAGPSKLLGGVGGTKLEIGSSGSLNLDGGQLVSVNNLFVTDGGTINLNGGAITGSSGQQDKLTLEVNVFGVGAISATNSSAGQSFNGLTTNSYDTVDAAAASTDATSDLYISGGVFNNYGTLEAAPNGALGAAILYIDQGAIVDNVSSGSITTGTGGLVELVSSTIIDGKISGELDIEGTGNTLTTTSGGSLNLDSTTYVDGTVAIGGAGVINNGYMQVDGNAVIKNTFNNDINGVIDVFGTFTTATAGGIGNSGQIIADEGTVTFNSDYFSSPGEALIEYDGVMKFNTGTSNVITFATGTASGGTLVLDHGANVGSVKNFDLGNDAPAADGDVINFRDVAYSAGETGTLTQDGQIALVQVGSFTVQLQGVYTASTSPITFGTGDNGSGFFALAEGPASSTSLVVYPGA